MSGRSRGSGPRRIRLGWILVSLPLLSLAAAREVDGQVISPGKLAQPHAELNGITRCTRCHQLRKGGVSNDKCLQCHEPLRSRIEESRGFHASVGEQNCGACHKEHFGPDFEMIRFDTTTFEHDDEVGFALVGSHLQVTCRDCHKPDYVSAADVLAFKGEHAAIEKTFLGLGAACSGCHASANPHDEQFSSRGCEDCHDEDVWEKAPRFDHNTSRYRLTGLHRKVKCEECHKPIRRREREPYIQFVNIAFASCEACHSDVHESAMGKTCDGCHVTAGWNRINGKTFEGRFDHSSTQFPLVGAHAEATCGTCHGRPPLRNESFHITYTAETIRKGYPHPVASNCISCHRDFHRGDFRATQGGADCESCHTEFGWTPGTYDILRHNRQSEFALQGAHLTTPCNLCHTSTSASRPAQFHFDSFACVSCHRKDDPHGVQFAGQACESCHDVQSFTIAAFDHSRTRYPLDGEHRDVACTACHPEERSRDGSSLIRYKPLGTECKDCHR